MNDDTEPSTARRRALALLMGGVFAGGQLVRPRTAPAAPGGQIHPLPRPRTQGKLSVEAALAARRSRRRFRDEALSLAEVGQLMWAAQGITTRSGFRTAPSAGALYPIRLYLAAGWVDALPPGLYRYDPKRHRLIGAGGGDKRASLAGAVYGRQGWIASAPAVLMIGARVGVTARKYGRRAQGYALVEAGAVAENVYLQAAALDLGTTLVGAVRDVRLREIFGAPSEETPLGLMPVGRIRSS